MSKQYDLKFVTVKGKYKFKNMEFPECETITQVRSWLNECERFISVEDDIINLDQIVMLHLKESAK